MDSLRDVLKYNDAFIIRFFSHLLALHEDYNHLKKTIILERKDVFIVSFNVCVLSHVNCSVYVWAMCTGYMEVIEENKIHCVVTWRQLVG